MIDVILQEYYVGSNYQRMVCIPRNYIKKDDRKDWYRKKLKINPWIQGKDGLCKAEFYKVG